MQQAILLEQRYEYGQLIGKGSSAKVYQAIRCSDGKKCAIKKIQISDLDDRQKQQVLQEASILQTFDHPNIMKLLDLYQDTKHLCIVMDYMEGGSLSEQIKRTPKYLPENLILNWFTSICLAIKYMHDNNTIHRDLKPENILLSKDNQIKITDFGISKILNYSIEKTISFVGTIAYMSPEQLREYQYSFPADIWSLGVILFELCALKIPFCQNNFKENLICMEQGKYKNIPSLYSNELHILIGQLLQGDPRKRPTINKILRLRLIHRRIEDLLSRSSIKSIYRRKQNKKIKNLSLESLPKLDGLGREVLDGSIIMQQVSVEVPQQQIIEKPEIKQSKEEYIEAEDVELEFVEEQESRIIAEKYRVQLQDEEYEQDENIEQDAERLEVLCFQPNQNRIRRNFIGNQLVALLIAKHILQ